ncbi:MAG: beta-ketoacyl-ACP synthase III [Gloeomargarita sp. SKYBB_i_bin120]|nr:ketoacyl-ACP synthase III [Gloeomargarita sp. SKYG98]MCS7291756.1 ketoacyl-ACP synthase III [Gloeomargarita sp. SKYB120]MDW8177316.1 beta-ketoacyl-ACP synthase III [Gloeomargarita sp. SKYBB_i_bin120]
MLGVRLTGTGRADVAPALDNHQLSRLVDTSDEWIVTRTGIRTRRLAAPHQGVTDLAVQAAQNALVSAGLSPLEVELVILATSTPDDLFGSASLVLEQLGAKRAVAFDLTAACSGFVFGLVTAAQFLKTGTYRRAVVIGADVLSRWVDWRDRRTCVLFGDGAGAVVLETSPQEGLLGFELQNDGSQNACLTLAYQGQPQPLIDDLTVTLGAYQPIAMNGQEVYKFAVKRVPEVIEKALFRAGLTSDQIDYFVLHQANQRILEAVATRLGVPPERMLSNVARYGNTSAASIPLVLDEAVRAGQIQAGHTLVLAGFGAGLTLGAVVCRWG